MKNKLLAAALANGLTEIETNTSAMIDLIDDDLDAVAGGGCTVFVVKCQTSYTTTGGTQS